MLTGNNRERATPTPTGPLGGFTAAQPPLGRPLHPPPPSTFSQSLIRFYASIDFGASHSGFAFAHDSDKVIKTNYTWSKQPQPYCKDLTAVLYEENQEGIYSPVAFGYEALQRHLQRRSPSSYFLTRFKLLLDPSSNVKIDLPPGISKIQVVADYLRYMGNMAMEKLAAKFGATFNPEYIRWSVTVPAIWSPQSKAMTRQACFLAGLITTIDSMQLLMCLEPEAATLQVKHQGTGFEAKDGQVFTVCDCGGGTIDISTFKVLPGGGMAEVIPSSGAFAGSTYVDQEFLEWFKFRVGSEAYYFAKAAAPSVETEILKSWEGIKRNFKGVAGVAEIRDFGAVAIPRKLEDRITEDTIERLAEEQEGVEEFVWISDHTVKFLFDKVIDKVIMALQKHLNKVYQCNERPSAVLVVGGFSESEYLVNRIREEVETPNCKVLSPAEPGSAIVVGAVLFAMDSSQIKGRRSRLTYGTRINQVFDPLIHPKERAYWNEKLGQYRVAKVFNQFVKAGQLVESDEVVRDCQVPLLAEDQTMTIWLYSSPDPEVRFTDEQSAQLLAEVQVDFPSWMESKKEAKEVHVLMRFGRTELEFEVYHVGTKQRLRTSVQFQQYHWEVPNAH